MDERRINHIKTHYLIYRDLVSFISSPLSAAYMRRGTGSAMAQIMACRLDGAKPLSKPIADMLSFGTQETQFNEISFESHLFSFKKMRLKMSSAKWRPFCPGGDELTSYYSLPFPSPATQVGKNILWSSGIQDMMEVTHSVHLPFTIWGWLKVRYSPKRKKGIYWKRASMNYSWRERNPGYNHIKRYIDTKLTWSKPNCHDQ